MIESGLLLFFIVPGLLAYCALYGAFHSGRSIAPEPPSASSIEAVTIILLSSVVVHVTSAVLIHVNHVVCNHLPCPIRLPRGLLDPYAAALGAIEREKASGEAIGGLLGVALSQGIAAYALVRFYLHWEASRDRLPAWIYGWATDIANAADNDTNLIVAYILTNHDHDGKTIVYAGALYDMALKSDGSIARMTLWDCERYLANLGASLEDKTLPAPLSRFPFMIIDGAHIRNVAFEIVDLAGAEMAQR